MTRWDSPVGADIDLLSQVYSPLMNSLPDPLLLAVFDDCRIGIVDGEEVVDITSVFEEWKPTSRAIVECLGEWPRARKELPGAWRSGSRTHLADVRLMAPVPEPRNLLCAPVNYRSHQGEIVMDRSGEAPAGSDARSRGFFLKSPSSVIGPSSPIELPKLAGRDFHYEAEIAVVIGSEGRGVPASAAWDHVLGLTGFVDVTMRPSESRTEERSMRKSFATFAPMGPYLMVTDGEPDLDEILVELLLNGELRQRGSLRDLIVDVPHLIEIGASVFPLMPGDVFATGTPAGVGALHPGDRLQLRVSPIGEMSFTVEERPW